MSASTSTVLTLSATLLLASIVSGADECSQNRRTTVKIVPHSEDCQQYVVCVGRIRLVRNCPEESGWSETKQTCVPGERCRKKPKLRLMSVAVAEVEPVITCVPNSESCPARFDPTALVLRAHEDCAKYYLCISFLPVVLSCPADLRFNEQTCQCDFPANVNCGLTTTTEPPEATDSTTEEPEVTDSTTDEPEVTESTTEEPAVTDSTTSEPEVTDSTTAEQEVTDSTTEEPAVTDSTTQEPEVTDSTTDEQEVTDSTTEEPAVTESTTSKPDVTDSTTEEPEVTESTTEQSVATDSTTKEPDTTSPTTEPSTPSEIPTTTVQVTTTTAPPPTSSAIITHSPETSEATTVPAVTTTTQKPPVVIEIMEAVSKVLEVVDALKKIWYDYIWKKS
uniref:Putative chondroitin proteoglycan 1 n=1 Tax=Culex tarsalis TaxID=7177 RepID=A0A1Q3FQ53_CULTA